MTLGDNPQVATNPSIFRAARNDHAYESTLRRRRQAQRPHQDPGHPRRCSRV